jgi:hypothetical protein
MTERLIPPTFLFRFSVPCLYSPARWSPGGLPLSEAHRLPSFHAELGDGPAMADVRLGWSETGLAVNLRVAGKKQTPWCRDTRLEDSDGLSLWIDTRDTQNIHRASRFCHRFILLPQGAGRLLDQPVARQVEIARAKQHPKPVPANALSVRSEKRIDGYLLEAFLPATALTGYDPAEHPRLGFTYAVIDRELGWQTFSLGAEFPFPSDPSLWGSLELVRG